MRFKLLNYTNSMIFRVFVSVGLLVLLIVLAMGQKSLSNLEKIIDLQYLYYTQGESKIVTISTEKYLEEMRTKIMGLVDLKSSGLVSLSQNGDEAKRVGVYLLRIVSETKPELAESRLYAPDCPMRADKGPDLWPLNGPGENETRTARMRNGVVSLPLDSGCVEIAFLLPVDRASARIQKKGIIPKGTWIVATVKNTDLVQIMRSTTKAYSAVYDDRGRILVRAAKDRSNSIDMEASPKSLRTMLLNKKTQGEILEVRTVMKNDLLAVKYNVAKDFGLSLVLTLKPDAFYADVRRDKKDFVLYASLFLLIALLMAFGIASQISNPISVISKATREIAKGDFAIRVKVNGVNEITTLAGSVNELSDQISNLMQQQRDMGRINAEIETAQLVQETIFPDRVINIGQKYRASSFAAMASECGGDIWGSIPLPCGKICIYIADASGHGVPSAFITIAVHTAMSLLQSMAANGVGESWGPNEILKQLNKIVSKVGNGNVLMSMFIMVLDEETGEFEFANAGHTKPIWISESGSVVDKFICKSLLGSGNLLGFSLSDAEWAVERGSFHLTSKLVLYTDGLTENIQDLPTKVSKRSILKTIRTVAGEPGSTICQTIETQYLTALGDEVARDDCTVVVVEKIAA